MRQEDVFLTLRTGGTMTAAQITEALALDVTNGNVACVRTKLRKLRDKGLVRPVHDGDCSPLRWEVRE